jgi:predicted phosphodiesterase
MYPSETDSLFGVFVQNFKNELEKQVKYINNNKDDFAFVLHAGDATNLGLQIEWDLFYKQMKELKVPYIMVIGNHDLLTNGLQIYKKMFGPKLSFSFSFKQAKFIIFNNNNWESRDKVPDLGFIESELINSTSNQHFFLAHVQATDTDRYSQAKIDSFRDLVDNYNVDYLLSGHDHNPGVTPFGTSKRVIVGSSVKDKLFVLDINNLTITHEYIDL